MSSTNVLKILYENRYCNQKGFSILACRETDRNKKSLNQVLEVKTPIFEVSEFPSMVKGYFTTELTTINSCIFGFFENYCERK